MSFAPRSRSRERNAFQSGVAPQPRVPQQKEPLHRYGAGVGVPGVSMKGSHEFVGVVIDGKAITTKLNTNEKPSNLLRSTSPVAVRRPEVVKSDRTVRSKSPLPLTMNTVSLSRSRANSPAGNSTIVPNRTFLEISTKNINTHKRQTSNDDDSVGSFSISSNNRPNSASSVSSKSYTSSNARSQLRKSESFSIIENINQLNAFENKSLASRRSASPSLHRSLSQSKMLSNSPGIHNIQLTQGAYKTVRKSATKDELVDFMLAHRENCAAEDLGQIFESIGDEGKHYIQSLYNNTSSTPPDMKALSDLHRPSSPLTTSLGLTSSPNSAAEIKRIKKLLHLSKMCRDEIDREMVYYMSHTAGNLYFQMENEKSPVVRTAREELYRLVQEKYIPLLNGNLSKIRQAETLVLNDNKTRMNEVHAEIDAKKEDLAKIVETNNKLKSKVSKFLKKYDALNSDVFQQVMLESFGRTFTNTVLEQLRNPQLCVPHSRSGSPVNFPEDDFDEDGIGVGPDAEAFEIYGLERHRSDSEMHQAELAAGSPPPPPPPVKDRFSVNFDMIQQLASISPQVQTQRVAPDAAPPRKFPASPFVQLHSPNAMVQSVLQGYKSPVSTRFLHDVSLSTIGSNAAPGSAATATTGAASNVGTTDSPMSRVGSHYVSDADDHDLNQGLTKLDLTFSDNPRPSQIKSSDMMPHTGGINVIPNHHVRSQMLYRRSMSPNTIQAHHNTLNNAAAVMGSNAGSTSVHVAAGGSSVSSSVNQKPNTQHLHYHHSPGVNVRQEVLTSPRGNQSVHVTKVDYRQLQGVESFAASQRHSPKMLVRSPPKVPIPSFNKSPVGGGAGASSGAHGRSMEDVMMSYTY